MRGNEEEEEEERVECEVVEVILRWRFPSQTEDGAWSCYPAVDTDRQESIFTISYEISICWNNTAIKNPVQDSYSLLIQQ